MPQLEVIAYSLLVIEPGSLPAVLEALRAEPDVVEAHDVMGAYDVVVKVRAATLQHLHDLVFTRLRGIDGIRSTTTLITQSTPD